MMIGFYQDCVLNADRCDLLITCILQNIQNKDGYQALYTFEQLYQSQLFVSRVETNFDLIVEGLVKVVQSNFKLQFIEFVIDFMQTFKLNFTQDNYELLLNQTVWQVLNVDCSDTKIQKWWGIIQFIIDEANYTQQVEQILKPLLQQIQTNQYND